MEGIEGDKDKQKKAASLKSAMIYSTTSSYSKLINLVINWINISLSDCLTDWLFDWLIDWLT